jgi:Flp pilus assembly protein TadG
MTKLWFGPVEDHRTTENPTDSGRALIEVIFLAVLMLIPVVYILISLLRLQATTFAVTQAARDAGRAIDSAPTIDDGISRARQIAEIDLADQNIPTDQLTLQFVRAGTDCSAANSISPTLESGAVYDICVTAVVHLPGVPTILTGSNNTITGVYTVHIGDLRESR